MSPGGIREAAFADLPRDGAGIPAEGVVLLDVRDDDEYARGHLGHAVHVPLAQLPDRIDEVPPGTVWVHCERGSRAERAAEVLAGAGRRVVVLRQGVRAARAAGLA